MDGNDWDRRYATDELVWSAAPNRFVVSELTGMPPGLALDLGTGEGRNAVWLAEQGWKVTGLDFSQVGLDKARRLAASRGVNVTWAAQDLTELRPGPVKYDLVLICYIHLPPAQRAALVRTALLSLADEGTLLVIGHDLSNLTEGTGGPQDPDLLYTPDLIVSELGGARPAGTAPGEAGQAGAAPDPTSGIPLPRAEILRAERVERPVRTDDEVLVAIDTLVRAVRH